MTLRQDGDTDSWPLRPWIMAAICAVGGLIFDFLTDLDFPTVPSVARQAAATFVAIAIVSFVLTVEQRRWLWSIAFAAGWGAVVALVGWFTASYNSNPTIFEWPFLSGLFAVLLAAPLFQTVRDEGAWRFPYAKLHSHAWTDAVIGAAALVFTGISFLLAWLIAGLFDLIGIDLIKDLLQESWFGWTLAGFAFGAAVGLLRERDALVATLQRLVMVVLGVLAPVLAAALLLFLLSIPFTGLGKLWDSDIPATPLMLLAGAGAILLANAVIGNGTDDRATSRVLRISAQVLVLAVLPLAIIAAVSLGQRIGQYGWTPERIWGVVAVVVAILYGLVGWWVVIKGRNDFDDLLRPLQTKMALGLCGLALFLALPILDFGSLSARSQLARLENGQVKPEEFDWAAMAFDFGPEGRERLAEIGRTGPAPQRELAVVALKAENRHATKEATENRASAAALGRKLRVVPEGTVLSPGLRDAVAGTEFCKNDPCVLIMIDNRLAILAGYHSGGEVPGSLYMTAEEGGRWSHHYEVPTVVVPAPRGGKSIPRGDAAKVNLNTATIELRPVQRRQLYIDGQPVGDPIE